MSHGRLNPTMRGVISVVALLMLALTTTVSGGVRTSVNAAGDDGDWRNRTVDPENWSDGPELEGSPMDEPRPGDPVIIINVSYQPGHLQSRVEGYIVIELFEEWAPITVTNMVDHVEIDLYDGIFFHRVIDDFVAQGGDPTCKSMGPYPSTSLQCGSGGTGETIPMEHNENLSHVDGAIGMARDMDPDSADSQWYITETEAHNLDAENRNDEGYAVFGVVRDGMTHVRAITLTPTSDDPTGLEMIQNPASSAGRPLYEVHISEISMLGVVLDPNASIEEEPPNIEPQGSGENALSSFTPWLVIGILAFITALALRAGRVIEPVELELHNGSED